MGDENPATKMITAVKVCLLIISPNWTESVTRQEINNLIPVNRENDTPLRELIEEELEKPIAGTKLYRMVGFDKEKFPIGVKEELIKKRFRDNHIPVENFSIYGDAMSFFLDAGFLGRIRESGLFEDAEDVSLINLN